MKTQNSISKFFLIGMLTLALANCSKEEIVTAEQEEGNQETLPPGQESGEIVITDGTSADRFDTYAGEIGFVLDTRELAKKGYTPVTAEIDIEAETGDFSQTIEIDPISFMGQIRLIKEELPQDAIDELADGVFVTWTIKDVNDQTITSDSRTTSFQSNPSPVRLLSDGLEETDENRTINLSEDTSYYFQPIDEKRRS